MTSTATTRHNPHLGIDCPPWCHADHRDDGFAARACVGQTGSVDFGDGGLDSIWACAILAEQHSGRPAVGLTGHRYRQPGSAHVEVPGHAAESLAGLLGMLADATPEQHRELAAAIRKAAADITDGGQ